MTRSLSRRNFLKLSGTFAAWAALSACKPRAGALTTQPPNSPTLQPPGHPATPLSDEAAITHTLRRLTFGLTPEMIEHARTVGLDNWLEEQLRPETLDDSQVDNFLSRFSTLTMTPAERFLLENRGQPVQEIIAATLLRQRFSNRQVYEMLVDFWTNHFNIFIGKNQCRVLKTDDDLQAIRPNALGQFKDLLWASAHSPAMLVYLDQAESTKDIPNENYARELMELHTISVESGYSHHDVEEVARALTGWSIARPRDRRSGAQTGAYLFRAGAHDDDEKHILDLHLPAGGGERDGETVLDYLAHHDWTARFIGAKLARRFVADDPPQSLVESLIDVFQSTGGDTRELVRALVQSDEFKAAAGTKVKRPLEFFISTLRVTSADITGQPRPLVEHLRLLGQIPFTWQTPDGYPDYAAWWTTTSGLLNRWNFCLLLTANEIRGTRVDLKSLTADAGSPADVVDVLSQRFVGEILPDDARDILIDFASAGNLGKNLAPVAGLILGSPHFQVR